MCISLVVENLPDKPGRLWMEASPPVDQDKQMFWQAYLIQGKGQLLSHLQAVSISTLVSVLGGTGWVRGRGGGLPHE